MGGGAKTVPSPFSFRSSEVNPALFVKAAIWGGGPDEQDLFSSRGLGCCGKADLFSFLTSFLLDCVCVWGGFFFQ